MKIKTFTKIVSGILCAALTMQIGLGVTKKQAHAEGFVSVDSNNIVELQTPSGSTNYVDFFISAGSNGGYVITTTAADGSESTTDVASMRDLRLYNNVYLKTQSDIQISNLSMYGNSTFLINEGHKVTLGGYTRLNGMIAIEKDGTLQLDRMFDLTFHGDSFRGFHNNGGTVIANSINLDIEENIFYDQYGSKYIASSSFVNGSKYLSGKVYTQPNTTIYNSGGRFTLNVDGGEVTVQGSYSARTAYEFFINPSLSFTSLDDVYYGQDYDMGDLLTAVNGYDLSNVEIQYANSQRTIIEKPTAVGSNYAVRAVAPYTGSYRGVTTAWQSFDIVYPTLEDFDLTSPYVSVSGVVNGKYIPGALTITAPEDYLLGSTTIPDVTGFSSSLSLTADQIANDVGEINKDLGIVFKNSDGWMTDDITLATAYPVLRITFSIWKILTLT